MIVLLGVLAIRFCNVFLFFRYMHIVVVAVYSFDVCMNVDAYNVWHDV